MTLQDPAQAAVAAELNGQKFRFGVRRGFWRVVDYSFPILVVAVSSTSPHGTMSEFGFQFELAGFPGTAPAVKIWDLNRKELLATNKRPLGGARVQEAFKSWGDETVYRPWERRAGAHGNWTQLYPQLTWAPARGLAFILEDLHELLNICTGAGSAGKAA